jgi:hypothetical protein
VFTLPGPKVEAGAAVPEPEVIGVRKKKKISNLITKRRQQTFAWFSSLELLVGSEVQTGYGRGQQIPHSNHLSPN